MDEILLDKAAIPGKSYTLAGRRGFLHRYADTGFKTKWCGIWFPPFKFFEYFAFRINSQWLSPQNISRFGIKRGEAVHAFSMDGTGIEAWEKICAPKKLSGVLSVLSVRNSSGGKKHVDIDLEAAVNIRAKAENAHERKYEASFSGIRHAVAVKSGGNTAIFGIGKTKKEMGAAFAKSESYKDHSPGGEPQRCFIPGKYTVSLELGAGETADVPFIFAGSLDGASDAFSDFDAYFRDWDAICRSGTREERGVQQEVITPDKEINMAYSWACENMQELIHSASFGDGFFAGYPWFLEFWGRDTFWSIRGLVDAGEFDEAKKIIRTMAAFQKKRMPCVVNLDRTASYHGADADALFILALDYYLALSGDMEFGREISGSVKSALDSLVLLDYLVQHAPQETWMDSIARHSTAVEIQSLWIEALRRREPEIAKRMHEKFIASFWDRENRYLYDTAGDIRSAKKTANALVPLVFGQLAAGEASSVLETAKAELASPFGIRTLSKHDKDYSPAAYHSGASWNLATAIAACAALNYGKADEGTGYLKAMASDTKRHTLGGMSECLNSDTGELLGCGMQLWSSALFVHAVDAYLFGISYDPQEKKLVLAPLLPHAWKFMERRNKKCANSVFDFSVARTRKGYDLDIGFKAITGDTTVSVFLPGGIKSAMLDGKKLKPKGERCVEFPAGRSNNLSVEILGI